MGTINRYNTTPAPTCERCGCEDAGDVHWTDEGWVLYLCHTASTDPREHASLGAMHAGQVSCNWCGNVQEHTLIELIDASRDTEETT